MERRLGFGRRKGLNAGQDWHNSPRVLLPQRRRALIVSSRPEEQAFLKTFLTHLGFAVHVASDKNSLIDFLVAKKPYELVLVSEHFEAIGLGFFPLYFRQGMGKYRAKLIYFGPRREVLGFDDCLDFAALISRSLG